MEPRDYFFIGFLALCLALNFWLDDQNFQYLQTQQIYFFNEHADYINSMNDELLDRTTKLADLQVASSKEMLKLHETINKMRIEEYKQNYVIGNAPILSLVQNYTRKPIKVSFVNETNETKGKYLDWLNEVYFCHNFTEGNKNVNINITRYSYLSEKQKNETCGPYNMSSVAGCAWSYGSKYTLISFMDDTSGNDEYEKNLVLHEVGHALQLSMDSTDPELDLGIHKWQISITKEYIAEC